MPVSHVTNGVHVPTWDSAAADALWTQACGKQRWLGGLEELTEAIQKLSDVDLWTTAAQERQDLVHFARERLAKQLDSAVLMTTASKVLTGCSIRTR